jgi:hypothetical protein
MSEKNDGAAQEHGLHQHAHAAPTTQQIRTVGQRRREAEEKLEHHLDEARHKKEHHEPATEPEGQSPSDKQADGGDIASIQNDDRLTAADRVDLIANQVLPEPDATGSS